MTLLTPLKIGPLVLGLALLTLVAAARVAVPVPQVELVAQMSTDRAAHQATLLATGKVLITGGCGGGHCNSTHASVDLYDPAANAILAGSRMRVPRASHVAISLPDGRVLVAGGWSGAGALASAEIYDPATGEFTSTGNMTEPRIGPVATALLDGRILVTGGEIGINAPLSSAEIFDPESSTFSALGAMRERRMDHVAVSLADGTVLIAGGRSARGELLRSAEIFDPESGEFRLAGEMSIPRHKHAGVLMPYQRVLVVGGSNASDSRGRYSSTEFYDPATGEFSPGPEMNCVRYKLRDAVLTLPSGEVVVAGGALRPEILDPPRRVFVPTRGELSGAQMFATTTLLGNGDVLIIGGYDDNVQSSSSVWVLRLPQHGDDDV